MGPIVFDAEMNEYNFEYPSPCTGDSCDQRKASLRIYHCPFCGGAAPASKRKLLFAVVPAAEERRLFEEMTRFNSLEEAIGAFGPPDEDQPSGLTIKRPEQGDTAPTVERSRTLRYSGLSETADVFLYESREGALRFWMQGKYLGRPAAGQES